MFATRNVIRYSYLQQLIDLSKYMAVAFISALIAMLLKFHDSNVINIIFNFGITLLAYISILSLGGDELIRKMFKIVKL